MGLFTDPGKFSIKGNKNASESSSSICGGGAACDRNG